MDCGREERHQDINRPSDLVRRSDYVDFTRAQLSDKSLALHLTNAFCRTDKSTSLNVVNDENLTPN